MSNGQQPPIPQFILPVIDEIVENEGGYNAVGSKATDRGGFTRAGITVGFYMKIMADQGKPVDRATAIIHLQEMSNEEIQEIYYENFFQLTKFEEITDQTLLFQVVDFAVNSGPKEATLVIQRAVNSMYKLFSIKQLVVDGVFGTGTATAINQIGPNNVTGLRKFFMKESVLFYIEDCERDVSQLANLSGWFQRAWRHL